MAHVRVYYPDGREENFPLLKTEMIVGRDSTCDIPLNDGIASRRHAKIISHEAGQFWIEDLKSKNGILLNDSPIEKERVQSGDRIGIGTCKLILIADTPPTIILQDEEAGVDTTLGTSSAWHPDQRLDLPQKRLEILYELNERLVGRLDRDDLLNELLEVCVEQLRFERAGIAIWKGKPHPPQWIHQRNLLADPSGEFRISRSVVDRALYHSDRTLIVDTADGQIDPTASMISNNIRSAMCVPMNYLQQVHGVIYGDRTSSTGGYTKQDIDFFAALGTLGATGLSTIQLVDEMQHRRDVEMQLQMARQIQAHLFPAEPLESGRLHIHALNDPGLEVSGDYYDYFPRDDGKVVVVIADVAGKGVPASLLMANLQAAVQIMLVKDVDLTDSVYKLNHLICKNVCGSRFITAIFGLIDPVARRFIYVNAGHLGPYVIRGANILEKIEMIPSFPIGVMEDAHYQIGEIHLPDSPSTLLFYTDGVPDATNEEEQQFQEKRLALAFDNNMTQPPQELIRRIRRSIQQFTRNHPQTDDITLVAVRLD